MSRVPRIAVAIAAVTGVASGLLGVGGFLMVPLLALVGAARYWARRSSPAAK
jgi:uncharacterized membrane protein YfcA